MAKCRDDRAEAGLRGQSAHGIDRGIDGVDAGLDRRENAGRAGATGVVGVEVNRQPGFLAQRPDQKPRGFGPANARHVLDSEDMRAGFLQFAL